MVIDPTLAGLGIIVAIIVYQTFIIRDMRMDIDDMITDIDEVIDSHNHLVKTLVDATKNENR